MGYDIHVLEKDITRIDGDGMYWLVGPIGMPITILSVIRCLHFQSQSDEPDHAAEADDLCSMLPKGLCVVGAVATGDENEEEAVRKAGNCVMSLQCCLAPYDIKSPQVIVAVYLYGTNGKFFVYNSQEGGKVEAPSGIIYEENPSEVLWTRLSPMRSQMLLKLPVYMSSIDNTSGYEKALSTAFESTIVSLRSSRSSCLVEYVDNVANKNIQVMVQPFGGNESKFGSLPKLIYNNHKEGSKKEKSQYSDFFPLETNGYTASVQLPMPLKVTLLKDFSTKDGFVAAPSAEYLVASEGTCVNVLNLSLDVLCLASRVMHLVDVVSLIIIPALIDQLMIMKKTILKAIPRIPKLNAYHFFPPGLLHPISTIYDLSSPELDMDAVGARRMMHKRFRLPSDQPLLRVANSLTFTNAINTSQDSWRLSNVHLGLPSSGVDGGQMSLISGSYKYYHYLQDKFDDKGWGCAYRSLQTIFSWFRCQHYTLVDVPSHRKIQEILVEIGDKEPSFIGSKEWIGAIELSFVLDKLLDVTCKIINVQSGADIPEKCRELALHFETQGTPVMIGGGVLAYTLLGVDFNPSTGEAAFLILDPHYTGAEDLKSIQNGGWCAWKRPVSPKGQHFFLQNRFYNLLLPQRPNTV